jgi:hypothetical protein
MKPREPLWSLKDLAGHAKVTESALTQRSKKHPIPPAFNQEDGRIDSRFGSVAIAGRYRRSAILEWFNTQDAATPFKRKA